MTSKDASTQQTHHVIIIGGTSGIGLALAKSYLAIDWHVSIVGSNADKIEHLQQSLATQYSNSCHLYQCDISQAEQLNNLFLQFQKTPFNQLIYSAGWYLNERTQSLSQADSEKMLAVNLQAFQQVFHWASEQLKKNTMNASTDNKEDKKTAKKLVCLASVAGILNYPDSSLYAKCKGVMIATCDAYRAGLEPFGIGVTCIASGYVDTKQLRALNDGDASHKPFIISEADAVKEIQHAIDNNFALYCFPKPMRRVVNTLSLLPKPLLNKLMTWQYAKQDKTKQANKN